MIVTLYLAHGTPKALGFKTRQRHQIAQDKASDLIWLPKSIIKLVQVGPSKVGTWPECLVDIPTRLAKKKGLV